MAVVVVVGRARGRRRARKKRSHPLGKLRLGVVVHYVFYYFSFGTTRCLWGGEGKRGRRRAGARERVAATEGVALRVRSSLPRSLSTANRRRTTTKRRQRRQKRRKVLCLCLFVLRGQSAQNERRGPWGGGARERGGEGAAGKASAARDRARPQQASNNDNDKKTLLPPHSQLIPALSQRAYGGSISAHSNTCSYAVAACSHDESRAIPRSAIASNSSRWSR